MKLRYGPSHQNAAKRTTPTTVESIYYYAFKLCNAALHGKKQVFYVLANEYKTQNMVYYILSLHLKSPNPRKTIYK